MDDVYQARHRDDKRRSHTPDKFAEVEAPEFRDRPCAALTWSGRMEAGKDPVHSSGL